MVTILRPPLIFGNWRRDRNSIAANSQQFIEIGFPPFIPAAVIVDTDHFPRGPLFARVEARRSVANLTWTPPNIALPATPVVEDPRRQEDWTNPRGRASPNLSFADSFKLPLQQTLPTRWIDRPNPVLRTVQRQGWTDSFKLPLQGIIQPNQYDWPNPPLAAKRNPQDWQLSTSIALSGAVQSPFFETEWPNPILRTVQRQGWTDRFKLPIQQVLPPRQTDWPNPVLRTVQRKDWQDSFKLPLQQTQPLHQTDWLNPCGPQRSLDLLTWTQPKAQEAAFVVNPGFNEWAVPDGPRWGRQDWIASSNIALLAAPAQMPLNQYNWPLPPRAPQRAITLLTHTDSFKLPLQQDLPAGEREQILPVRAVLARPDWQRYALPWAQAPPLRQNDWPVPRGPLPTHLRTWTDAFKLPLQQVIQPNQYNWPNPVLRTVRRQDWQQSTSIALSSAVQPPFFETEWPNPLLRTVQRQGWSDSFKLPLQQVIQSNQYSWPNPVLRTVQRRDWQDWFKLPLQQTIQANQYNWPNPILRTIQRQDWILPQPYVLNAVAEVVNPGFNEWAVPDGARQLRLDWIFPQPYTLNVVVVRPFVPRDWPNPRGSAPRQTNFTDSFKLPLQQTLPPRQTNWPNPLGPRHGRADWSDRFKLPLQQVLPPHQTDWPVPMGARRGRQDWQDYGLPGIQQPPKTAFDWPNPQRQRPRVFDWIQGTTAAQKFVQAPLNQYNWPNPSRRKVNLLPTWTDSFKLPLQQTLPPRQLDWPVPKGPRQPVITARDFIQITQPTPPIPPVYDADNTLKNEIRRLRLLDNKSGRTRFLKNEIRR